MKRTFSTEQVAAWTGKLQSPGTRSGLASPSVGSSLQPVHVVYGGAHLFQADTAQKLGRLALRSMEEFAPDADTFSRALKVELDSRSIYDLVAAKLKGEPVEDYRIDFEDGYGIRPDQEEDEHAKSAALAVAEGMRNATLPRNIGIRIKALTAESPERGIRTMDVFLTTLLGTTGGILPKGFVITLPKVEHENQVNVLVQACEVLESALSLSAAALKLELMVESPRALLDAAGNAALPRLVAAGKGRVRGAHFGAFDFTAACGISAAYQDLRHPICDQARGIMQISLAGTGVWLSDSVTTVMPVPIHRGDDVTTAQREENRHAVHAAWKMHYDNIRHSLMNGFYQSWDLHPAQLPVRYAAVQMFFRENLTASARRLQNFVERATQASVIGSQFDDAATAQGLLNFFALALANKVLNDEEALGLTGLSSDEIRGRSFFKIMNERGQ